MNQLKSIARHLQTQTLATLALIGAALLCAVAANAQDEPPVVSPGNRPGAPPADAFVLFDGTNFDAWTHTNGEDVKWTLADGAAQCVPGTGSIISKRNFNDMQVHVEFATPLMADAESQERGNSGIYLQGRYEVQMLDSYEAKTYTDGQCGAIYGKHPPLVNVCRPPEQWQTYDIIFRAARFDSAGERTRQAVMTVFQNGVMIHDHAKVDSSTRAAMQGEGPKAGPVFLQDHNNTVRFRNVWVRPLEPQSEGR